MKTNQQEREEERRREPDTISGELLWVLWRHVRRTERRRRVYYELVTGEPVSDYNLTTFILATATTASACVKSRKE